LHEEFWWRKRRQISPEETEQLMLWPIGWTDLKPLATAKFQSWLQKHGSY
jgi:hypothetical protein